jgi:hypothetical protein
MNFRDENMGEKVISSLKKKCGDDVKIYPFAKIEKPEVIEVYIRWNLLLKKIKHF